MTPGELIQRYPYLASPAHLAAADMGERFRFPRHQQKINEAYIAFAIGDVNRLMINAPFQSGKSTISSHYYPPWRLIWKPTTRFLLVGHEERFASSWGMKVRDVLDRFGGPHGVKLRQDTKAKNEFVIDGHGGGMVCKGPTGGLSGRASDEFLIDDLIKDPEQALSPVIMDAHWNFYQTVVMGRMRRETKLAVTMTRWSKHDLCGHLLKEAKRTGEKWLHLKFSGLAKEGDILGRKPGEALWPEQQSAEHYEKMKGSRWYAANVDQDPLDEEGAFFRTGRWPEYEQGEVGFILPGRRVYPRAHCTIIVIADWATSEKRKADFTCFLALAVTPLGDVLVLECHMERLRPELSIPAFATFCRKWRPHLTVVEASGFQETMAIECRRHPDIPEPRRVKPEGKSKLQRALPAITMGENGRIYLPREDSQWKEDFEDQLCEFTGINDEHDDAVDCLSYGCQQVQWVRGTASCGVPEVLVPGYRG